MEPITVFRGEYHFLSNFWPWEGQQQIGPSIIVRYDGVAYPTSEHAFQAAKTLDAGVRAQIRAAAYPNVAKRLGRVVNPRLDWEGVKLAIMWTIVLDKFARNPELLRMLLATGNARLVEGNTWGDTTWGVCRGVGKNLLGEVLMSVRTVLRGPHE